MEDELYKKIGKQEMMIEALKRQSSELSAMVAKFVSGEEKPADWEITAKGQIARKASAPAATHTSKPKA